MPYQSNTSFRYDNIPSSHFSTADDDDESSQETAFQGDDARRDNVHPGIRSKR